MTKAFLLSFIAILPVVGAAQNYIIQTVAGTTSAGDGGPATAALLVQAEGIAIDSAGNVYLADAGDNRVRKVSPDGVIHSIAGTGIAGLSGDGGPAISAQLNHPYGIALDSAGNLYIADLGNARVRKVTAAGVIITVAGGSTTAPLNAPRNVAVDNQGNLFISDFGAQQVYQMSSSGALSLFAGTGKTGYSGDGGAATLARLAYPAGLAADASGNVFIADSGNNCVRRVSHGAISTVSPNVPSPTGVAVDINGHIYVASSVPSRTSGASSGGFAVDLIPGEDAASNAAGSILYVAKQHSAWKLTGAAQTTIAGTPNYSAYGEGGVASQARLAAPVALAIDNSGNIYLAEQNAGRIRKVAADGTISIVAGDAAQMKNPSGIAVDSHGTMYFSDTGNNRVRRVSAGGVLSNVVDKLAAPTCVRAAGDGSLYVCDTGNNRVLKVTPSGLFSAVAVVPAPSGLAISNDGSIFVSTASQVVQISSAGAISTILDGLDSPTGIALDTAGELLIAESGRNRILKLGAAGVIDVVAGTGQAGASGDGGLASSALLNNPTDVALDNAGNILIADTGNNFIRELSPAPLAIDVALPPLSVASAASMLPGPVAPNEIVAIFGSGFDPDHTQVTFDNTVATVFYASPTQLNVLVPPTLQPTTTLNVYANGTLTGTATLSTAAAAPALFTMSSGTGPAAALNEDLTLNTTDNPEPRGGIIVLYLTGDNGLPGTVQIGGYTADVLYDGPVPGYPGLTQINARVPAGFLPTGVQPVVVAVNGITTQPGVTIVVR